LASFDTVGVALFQTNWFAADHKQACQKLVSDLRNWTVNQTLEPNFGNPMLA
jgi:hypothetical protein